MLQSWIDGTITFCIRYFRTVILAGLILAAVSAVYAARHFAINTDINDLISAKLPWRQHEIDFQRAFPQTVELIIADVHAPTPEAVKAAARELQKALADKPGLFRSTIDQFDSPFFRRSGLLYLPPDRIEQFTEPLAKAKPLVAGLVTDPSLRGLLRVLGQLLLSTQQDLLPFDDLQRPLNTAAATLEDVAKGQPAEFSWRVLSQGDPKPLELHRFVQIRPVLDHDALEPGGRATSAIRDIVNQSGIEQKFGADVSLTGPTIISDNEFSGVHEGIVLNSVVTGAIVLAILWLALRSLRLVAAAVVTLAVGLLVTSAGGILIVGALNPISLAFAVLFVGLGADFAIQYTVRYRAERHEKNDLARSLIGSADWVGIPLTLAAGAAGGRLLVLYPHGLHRLGAARHYRRLRHGGCLRDEPDFASGTHSVQGQSARRAAGQRRARGEVQTQIGGARGEEGRRRGPGASRLTPPVADQCPGGGSHHLPAHDQQGQRTRRHRGQHAAGEQQHETEEAAARLRRADLVAGDAHHDQRHGRDRDHHPRGQSVDSGGQRQPGQERSPHLRAPDRAGDGEA